MIKHICSTAVYKNVRRFKNVSVSRGRTHFLLREHNIKRKASELETDDRLLELAQDKIEQLELKIAKQQDKIDEHERLEESLLKDKEKLIKLYQEGYIDSAGKPNQETN